MLLASQVICSAVLRYKELCEGRYKGALQLLPPHDCCMLFQGE